MTFQLFGDHGTYDHYQDNGSNFDYQTGQYNCYHLSVDPHQVSVALTHHGFSAAYQTIHLVLSDRVVTFTYDAQTTSYQQI